MKAAWTDRVGEAFATTIAVDRLRSIGSGVIAFAIFLVGSAGAIALSALTSAYGLFALIEAALVVAVVTLVILRSRGRKSARRQIFDKLSAHGIVVIGLPDIRNGYWFSLWQRANRLSSSAIAEVGDATTRDLPELHQPPRTRASLAFSWISGTALIGFAVALFLLVSASGAQVGARPWAAFPITIGAFVFWAVESLLFALSFAPEAHRPVISILYSLLGLGSVPLLAFGDMQSAAVAGLADLAVVASVTLLWTPGISKEALGYLQTRVRRNELFEERLRKQVARPD
ncbi:MAG: hypothetical protein V4479_09645 [Actinomycetota bacterium]